MLRQGMLDATDTGSGVRADIACRSKADEALMVRRGFASHLDRRKPAGRPMPEHMRRSDNTKSRHRAPVGHVFAVRKHIMGLAVRAIVSAGARTRIGMTRIGMTRIACNIRSLVQLEGCVDA